MATCLREHACPRLPRNEGGGRRQIGKMAGQGPAFALGDEPFRQRRQCFRRSRGVHQSGFQRGPGRQLFTGENQLERLGQSDQARQKRAAAPARKNADLHLGQANLRFLGGRGDPIIAGQRHFAATTQRKPVDRRDRWNRQICDAPKGLLAHPDQLLDFFRRWILREANQVGAGEKDFRFGAAEYHALDRGGLG